MVVRYLTVCIKGMYVELMYSNSVKSQNSEIIYFVCLFCSAITSFRELYLHLLLTCLQSRNQFCRTFYTELPAQCKMFIQIISQAQF